MTDNEGLPTAVRGALVEYEVRVVERVDDADSAGEHDSQTTPPHILIRANQPPIWRWQTLFHELIHMIEEEQHLSLSEKQVERIALGLCACWHRNGWTMPGARP